MNEQEELLTELVHLLAYGKTHVIKGEKWREIGLSVKETKHFLTTPLPDHGGRTPLELLKSDGRLFINNLKSYLNKKES